MHFLINIPVISFFSVDFSINVVDNVVIIIYVTITIIIIIITIINIIIIRKQWLRLCSGKYFVSGQFIFKL